MNRPAPRAPLPFWVKALLTVQVLVAALFFLLAWSHTVSLAQGRAASLLDLAAIALPLILACALTAAGVTLRRSGRGELASLCFIAPFPLALVLYKLLGVV